MGKLGLNVVAGLGLAAVAFACASDPPEDFVPPEGTSSSSGSSTIPGGGGDGGGSSSGGSSGTTSSSGGSSSGGTDSGTAVPADCSKMATVDDRPACDTCTKQKCCTQLQACDASPACKAAQNCLAACASDDFICILSCSATGGNGAQLLQDVGTCASQQCASECPSTIDFDGGFPF
jgi:hypothetical protein